MRVIGCLSHKKEDIGDKRSGEEERGEKRGGVEERGGDVEGGGQIKAIYLRWGVCVCVCVCV